MNWKDLRINMISIESTDASDRDLEIFETQSWIHSAIFP